MAEAYQTTGTTAGAASAAGATGAAGAADNDTELSAQITPLGRVNSLINIARSGTSYAPTTSTLLPDYVPLPEGNDDITYTIDRNAGISSGDDDITQDDNMQCPDQLEDMLVIVRALREKQYMSQHTLASFITDAEAEEAKPKERSNNLKFANMSDLEEFET